MPLWNAVLTAGADQVRRRWGEVVLQMLRTSDGAAYQPTGSLLTLAAEAPSRPAPGTPLARKLEQAALHVLCEAPVLHADDIGRHGLMEFRQAPELTAFALLDSLSGLPDDAARWAGWSVALASFPTYQADALSAQHRFLPECTRHAADALAPLLTAALNAADDGGSPGSVDTGCYAA